MPGKYTEVSIPASGVAYVQPASGEHWLLLAEMVPIPYDVYGVYPYLYDGTNSALTYYNGLQEIQYFINASTYLAITNTYNTAKTARFQASSSDIPTLVGVVSVAAGAYVEVYTYSPYFRLVRLATGASTTNNDVIVSLYSPEWETTLLKQSTTPVTITPRTWAGCVCIGNYPRLRMYNRESVSRNLCYSMTGNIG